MTEPEDDELPEIELALPDPVVLMDDCCWIGDPEALHHESGVDEGVLALQFRGGCLFYLDAATRQWVNVDDKGPKKAKLRTVQ